MRHNGYGVDISGPHANVARLLRDLRALPKLAHACRTAESLLTVLSLADSDGETRRVLEQLRDALTDAAAVPIS